MNSEIERLQQQIRYFKEKGEVTLVNENRALRERINNLEVTLFLQMVELDRLNTKDDDELRKTKLELMNLQNANADGTGRLRETQAGVLKLTLEVEELTRLLKEKTNENQTLKSQFELSIREERSRRSVALNTSMIDYESRLNEYSERNELLARELDNLRSLLKRKSEETEIWVARFTELQLRFGDKELLVSENVKLRTLVDDLSKDLQENRLKVREIGNLLEKVRELEGKNIMLGSELERQTAIARQKTVGQDELTKAVIELESRLASLAEENTKVNELLDELKTRYICLRI